MARDQLKRLEQMRAYSQTPAGRASKKISQAKWIAKRRLIDAMDKPVVFKAQALANVMTTWR